MVVSEELSGELFQRYGKELKKGEVLFHENDIADEVYIVLDGKVRITKNIDTGRSSYEKLLSIVSKGEILGEMALLTPNSTRTASAHIIEDTKIIVIDRATFYAMIRYNAEFSLKLMERISGYVIEANKRNEELSVGLKRLLVVDEIISLADKNKNKTLSVKSVIESKNIVGQVDFDIVNKTLEKLEKLNTIKLVENNIEIISPELLKKFKIILSD